MHSPAETLLDDAEYVNAGPEREIIGFVESPGEAGSPRVAGERIRVGIVDDHAMVAEGLGVLLREERDLEIVGIAATVAEAIELVERRRPHVLLLDYRLPDGDGATAATEILRRWPSTKVVMLSAAGGDELLARSIEAGCSGFLPKDRSGHEVVSAVRAAYRGESLIPTAVLSGLLDRLRRAPQGKAGDLTQREFEVLRLLAKGMSTEGISSLLFLSEHTVRNHVRNILAKLGAHSKLEAVAVAARDGIISLEDRT
ncbi:MAG TPA: response regulator transcription factor [Acidimicrobiales bacterium]|nr:response regulator transcription factor [Acidimicrobiales bacterium]